MSETDHTLDANRRAAPAYRGRGLAPSPSRRLIVITCMDVRIAVLPTLGLDLGEAHILRNAGAAVTDDVIRSVALSMNQLGTREIMLIAHTRCGLQGGPDRAIHDQLRDRHGPSDHDAMPLHTFTDLEAHVRDGLARLKTHPWLADQASARGFVFDIESGLLREVV